MLARRIAAREIDESHAVELSGRELVLLRDRLRAMGWEEEAQHVQLDIECCTNRDGAMYMDSRSAKEYWAKVSNQGEP